MIKVWYVNCIYFIAFYILFVNSEYLYPVHFELSNINEYTSPFLFEFEDSKIIIINDETYQLIQSNVNPLNYTLTPISNELFRNIVHITKASHSYYQYTSGDYISYIFPFSNNKIVYLYKVEQSFVETVDESIEEIEENSKADENEKITPEDLTEGKVTNFDCLFNKLI